MYLPNLALKATVVLAMAWMLAILFRRRSAAWRHLIWTSAFGALLVLPLLSAVLPALPVRVPAPLLASEAIFQVTAGPPVAVPTATNGPGHETLPPAGRSSRPNWLLLLWALGTALLVTQLSVNWLNMLFVRRAAKPFPDLDFSPWMRALRMRRPVELLQGRRGSMPMAFGLFRPVVFLPTDAAGWTLERRRVVILHELAHVQRGDLLLHLISRAALSLYWWNPLAWLAWREFLKERERAADDLVLNAGARPSDYAGHLLDIARALQVSPALGSAALAMARPSQLEGRLLAILDSGANRQAPRRISFALAGLLVLAALVPFAALRAQDRAATLPADVDATIRAAVAQKNHEMLESAAKAAEVLQKYDLARRLLDSSLDIRAEQSGAQSIEYGMGLVKLGDLERSRGNVAEAEAFYNKAVSVLGSRPEAAPVLIRLGVSLWSSKNDVDAAAEFFHKAQVADPTRAGMALTWLALAQKEPAAGEDLFKQALALEFPGSNEKALTMELYASFLNRQNRSAEASSWREQASAARKGLGTETLAVSRISAAAVRVGGGVTAPKLLYKVEPRYTEEARLAKYQGVVVVAANIGTDGTAQSMSVVSGLGLGLDEEALKAISQWKFQPGAKDGQPVAVQAVIEVNFRLL